MKHVFLSEYNEKYKIISKWMDGKNLISQKKSIFLNTNLSILSMTTEHRTIKRKFMQGKMQGPINIWKDQSH